MGIDVNNVDDADRIKNFIFILYSIMIGTSFLVSHLFWLIKEHDPRLYSQLNIQENEY